jgi:hypothetical protein
MRPWPPRDVSSAIGRDADVVHPVVEQGPALREPARGTAGNRIAVDVLAGLDRAEVGDVALHGVLGGPAELALEREARDHAASTSGSGKISVPGVPRANSWAQSLKDSWWLTSTVWSVKVPPA